MTGAEKIGASVKVEGGMVVIKMTLAQVHPLLVALEECPCKAPKSKDTQSIRRKFADALAAATAPGRVKK